MAAGRPVHPQSSGVDPAEIGEVETLVQTTDEAALARLAELSAQAGPEGKAARRALFLLRQRGLSIPVISRPASEDTVGVRPAAKVTFFASTVGKEGTRYLIAHTQGSLSSAGTVQVLLVNDLGDVLNIYTRSATKGRLEKVLATVVERGYVVAEISKEYAALIVRRAAESNSGHKNLLPNGFADFRRVVGDCADETQHPLSTVIDLAALMSEPCTAAGAIALLAEPAAQQWFIVPRDAANWLVNLIALDTSELVLTPSQKADQREKLIDEAADDLLSDKADLWRQRLEDSAYVLYLADFQDVALRVARHAISLSDCRLPSSNPFLRALTSATLLLLEEMYREEYGETTDSTSASSVA